MWGLENLPPRDLWTQVPTFRELGSSINPKNGNEVLALSQLKPAKHLVKGYLKSSL